MTQCCLGLPVNSDRPSRYDDKYLDRDTIKSRACLGADMPHLIAQSGVRRPSGRDGEHEHYQLPGMRNVAGSQQSQSTGTRQLVCSPSQPDVDSSGSLRNQSSAQDMPIAPSLDFKGIKRSPHKYVRQNAGESGLSMLFNSGHSVPRKQTGLEDQSDCARARMKAILQRSGRHVTEKETRAFDYGTGV